MSWQNRFFLHLLSGLFLFFFFDACHLTKETPAAEDVGYFLLLVISTDSFSYHFSFLVEDFVSERNYSVTCSSKFQQTCSGCLGWASLCHGVAFGKARSSVTEQTSRTAARLRKINALLLSDHLLSRRNVVKTASFALDWGTESRRRRRDHSRCTWTQEYYNGSRGGFPLPSRACLDELAPGPREQPPRRLLEQLKHPVSGFISFLHRMCGDLGPVRRLTRRDRGRKDRRISRIHVRDIFTPENHKNRTRFFPLKAQLRFCLMWLLMPIKHIFIPDLN